MLDLRRIHNQEADRTVTNDEETGLGVNQPGSDEPVWFTSL
jgi:hypothetical protein